MNQAENILLKIKHKQNSINPLEKIKNTLFYAGATKQEFESIEPDIVNTNRTITTIFSSVAIILIFTMFCFSFIFASFSKLRNVYMLGIVFSGLVLFFSKVLSYKNNFFSYAAVYFSIIVFLTYGIAVSITKPDQQTVTFMVMMMLLSVIFVDKPLRMGGTILFFILSFVFLASKTKTRGVLEVDIVDSIIFGTLSIASSYVVINVKVRGFIMKNQLKVLSETDILTGLNNRTCYELNIPLYAKTEESLACVYIDVNGLHAMNNEKGHKAGDKMLISISDSIKTYFEKQNTYRIGGDEFVVFIQDKDEKYLKETLAKFLSKIESDGYNVAIGYNFQQSKTDITELILQAEKQMYNDKKIYYQTHTR